MTRLPTIKDRQLLKALRRAGFIRIRHNSTSHAVLVNRKNLKMVVVPIHGGKDIKRGTLKGILKQAGLSENIFRKLL